MPRLLSCVAFLKYWACFPPQEKDAKKINVFSLRNELASSSNAIKSKHINEVKPCCLSVASSRFLEKNIDF